MISYAEVETTTKHQFLMLYSGMAKAKKPIRKTAKKKGALPDIAGRSTRKRAAGFVLGANNFTKISAVEGITITEAMKSRAAQASKKGLTPAQYRRSIMSAHRKG